jgi:putative transposase
MILERGSEFSEISVQRCCRACGVPRSMVYRKARQASGGALLEAVLGVLERFPCYGYRRVAWALGLTLKRTRTFMKRHGLERKQRVRSRPSGSSAYVPSDANLLPFLEVRGPARAFASDVTYIRVQGGRWAYLAVVLDIFTRQVVGWAISGRNDTELTKAALTMMLTSRDVIPGWVHHSDRGSNYAAGTFQELVETFDGLCSFSDPASPIQNAYVESFFKTFKLEEANSQIYTDVKDVQLATGRYLTLYNTERLHSSLGMKSPDQFYAEFKRAA